MSKSNKRSADIRFAGLTRVSTERQEQQGESLRTQRRQVEHAAKRLGGTVVKWYEGQEHATEGHERKRFDQMLRDASHKLFDALIVADTSRLSRDPLSSLQLIQTFKAHRVRLFVLEKEHDLFNPGDRFVLRLLADVHAFAVEENLEKSRQNRIGFAKSGYPSSGTLPFGRKCDKGDKQKPRWSIDPVAKKLLERIAERVLRGESLERITSALNRSGEVDPVSGGKFNANTLRRRLRHAGSKYVQKFRHNGEIVEVASTIPALLPDEVVSRIKRQLKDNKIVTKQGRVYSLAHIVRCGGCGSVLSGAGTKNAIYYRHHSKRRRGEGCVNHVPAEQLDVAVLGQLGELLKRDQKLKANIQQAVKIMEGEDDDLDSQISALEARAKKMEREIKNLIDHLAERGASVWKSVESGLKERQERLSTIRSQLSVKRERKADRRIPADLGSRVRAIVKELTGRNGYQVFSWDRASQQRLALYFLGGPVLGDPRRGIWVKRDHALEKDFGGKVWTYRIEGDLAVGSGAVTLTSNGGKAVVPAIDDDLNRQALRSKLDANTLVALASRVAANRSVKLRGTRARS